MNPDSNLSSLARTLAERLCDETAVEVEAVANALYDDREGMDLRDGEALKDALTAVRSLKPVKQEPQRGYMEPEDEYCPRGCGQFSHHPPTGECPVELGLQTPTKSLTVVPQKKEK